MNLYIISTPYHLLNIINICYENDEFSQADLIVLSKGSVMSQYYKRIKEASLFNNVTEINIEKNQNRKYIWKQIELVKDLFIGCKWTKGYEKKYDNIFIAGTDGYSKILYYKVRNKTTKLFFYEDGLASYYKNNFITGQRTVRDIIYKARYKKTVLELCDGLYVYRPECLFEENIKFPVYTIKKVESNDKKYSEILKSVFEISSKKGVFLFEKPAVFFNAYFDANEKYQMQNEYIKYMSEIIHKDKCYVKCHPNEKAEIEQIDGIEYIGNYGSFEINNYFQDLGEHLFVSIISTACLTPKILYNQEPYIIYLYKMYQSKYDAWPDIDEVFQRFRNSYSDKSRFYIPANKEEYVAALREIKNRMNK